MNISLKSMGLKTNQNLHKFESPDSGNLKLLTQVRFNSKIFKTLMISRQTNIYIFLELGCENRLATVCLLSVHVI